MLFFNGSISVILHSLLEVLCGFSYVIIYRKSLKSLTSVLLGNTIVSFNCQKITIRRVHFPYFFSFKGIISISTKNNFKP